MGSFGPGVASSWYVSLTLNSAAFLSGAGVLIIWGVGRSTNSWDGRIYSASLAGDEEAY